MRASGYTRCRRRAGGARAAPIAGRGRRRQTATGIIAATALLRSGATSVALECWRTRSWRRLPTGRPRAEALVLLRHVENDPHAPKRALASAKTRFARRVDAPALRAAVHQWLAANLADATVGDRERHALESLELAEKLGDDALHAGALAVFAYLRHEAGEPDAVARGGGAALRSRSAHHRGPRGSRSTPPGVVVRPPRPVGELHPRRDPYLNRPPGQGGQAHGRARARAGSAGRAPRVEGSLDARELGDRRRPLGTRREHLRRCRRSRRSTRAARGPAPSSSSLSSPSIAARSGMPANSWPAAGSWHSGSRTHSLPSRPSSASQPARAATWRAQSRSSPRPRRSARRLGCVSRPRCGGEPTSSRCSSRAVASTTRSSSSTRGRRPRTLGRERVVADATRCRGLLAAARGEIELACSMLEDAARRHERVGDPFGQARALLALA